MTTKSYTRLKEKIKKTYSPLVEILTLIIFSYTAVFKILNIQGFQLNIVKTGIFYPQLIQPVSFIVIAIELLVISLIVLRHKKSIHVSLLSMTAFTFYIIFAKIIGKFSTCGCGGVISQMTFLQHITFNLIVITMLSLTFLFKRKRKSIHK
ncbi:MauE/DoxX family redox-associated membrane protein [Ichthyobacterium seriolicida]|uniref:Methylamine utilisation protein MauE domain-containing protein n=1 Tax=Ichthyobacterium seriolicida TaxID=242600 RepID=A0A1J1E3F8_9FLAO|nr:hypothetical protein JBKA6_0567 [Ichthyobacterium seriolicida]